MARLNPKRRLAAKVRAARNQNIARTVQANGARMSDLIQERADYGVHAYGGAEHARDLPAYGLTSSVAWLKTSRVSHSGNTVARFSKSK